MKFQYKPDRPGFRKAGAAPERLAGAVYQWGDGNTYGLILGEDGTRYFLSADELPARTASLPVGTAVEFASEAAPRPGTRYLYAMFVRVVGPA